MTDPVRGLLAGATARQRELEQAVFRTPPPTMEAFQQVLGRWLELEETATWLKQLLDDQDKDEEDDDK